MKSNITSVVMKKVAGLEKRRVFSFFALALLFVLGFVAISGFLFQGTSTSFSENSTLDSFELLKEDWEIISIYWKDTLSAFVSDLPIAFYILLFVVAIGIITFPGVLLGIIRRGRKLLDIEKYQKASEND